MLARLRGILPAVAFLKSARNLCVVPFFAGILALPPAAPAAPPKPAKGTPLRIYFVDVEGGQATLFVMPNHKSLLVDTGFPGNEGRDASRIMRAAKLAGIDRIDYLLITHYHLDHAGGVPELTQRIPVGTFIDHGPNRELLVPATKKIYDEYKQLLATGKYKHLTVKPGDKLPIEGADFNIVTGDGNVISQPLPGAGRINPLCREPIAPPNVDFDSEPENEKSLGFEMTFGKLRLLDLGDFIWPRERDLVCLNNKIGRINLLVVSHHGDIRSSSPVFVNAIAPQVAIMDNGARKGGTVPVLDVIRDAPGQPALWQLHYSIAGGDEHNTDRAMIANLSDNAADDGKMITVEAYPDGRFKVTNERTGESRDYLAH